MICWVPFQLLFSALHVTCSGLYAKVGDNASQSGQIPVQPLFVQTV